MVTQWYSDYASVSTSNWTNYANIKVSDTNWANNTGETNYLKPWNWSQAVTGDSITGIEVRVDCKSDDASSNNYFDIDLSWDGGTSWTTAKRCPASGGVGTSENVVYLGGASDDWGHTWTFANLSASNFQIRAVYEYDTGTTGSIDYFAWRAHTEWTGGPWHEQNQGDTDADDGTEEENPTSNYNWYNTGYSWNNIGYYDDSGTIYIDSTGITFRSVGIPSNAVINEAKIKIAAYGTGNDQDLDAKIWAVDTDDFAGFDASTNAIHTLQSSSATSEQVDWDVAAATTWTSQNWYDTPDIKTVIQEIIDRGGWSSGNDIGIAFTNDAGDNQDLRNIYDSYYVSGALAPILLVNYSLVDGNSAKANIGSSSTTYSKNSSARASIEAAQSQSSSAKANLSVGTFPLTDDFGDASLDQDKWELGRHATEASVEEDGVLKVKNSTATTSGYVKSRHLYLPQYTTLEVKVNQHCTDGGFKLCPTDPNGHQWDVYSEANWYNFQLIAGTVVSPSNKAGQIGGDSPSLTVPYWLRMRVDDTSIYFDYKDNLTDSWTNISSEVWSGTVITDEQFVYLTGYNTQTTGVPHYDDFNWQEGVQTEKNNAVKARIVRETTKANSSRGNLSTLGQQYNYAKANIFVADVEQNSSSKASIYRTESSSNKSLASILITQTQNNSAIADIFLENLTQNNSTKASITGVETQTSSSKANISGEDTSDNESKASIVRTEPQDSSAKSLVVLDQYGSLDFDGIDDYVDCGSASVLNQVDAISIELFIKPEVALEVCYPPYGGNRGVAAKVTSPEGSSTWSWQLRYGSTDSCRLGMQFNTVAYGPQWATAKQNLVTDKWSHIVATFDGTNIKFYVNGILTDTNVLAGATTIASNLNKLLIGSEGWSEYTGYFDGRIAEFRLWDKALDADDIAIHATHPHNTTSANTASCDYATNCKAHYPMKPWGNPTKLGDATENNADADFLASGEPAWSTDEPSIGYGSSAMANILGSYSKDSSAKASISAPYQQPDYAKANILRTDEVQENSARADIVTTVTYSKNSSAKANILRAGESQDSSAKSRIVRTETQDNSARANVYEEGNYDNSSKSNILRADETQDNQALSHIFIISIKGSSVKGSIVKTVEKNNSSRGNLLVAGQEPQSSKANIFVVDNISDSSAKANIFKVSSTDSSAKADIEFIIRLVDPADTSADLAPTTFVWRVPYRTDNKDVIFWIEVDDTDENFNSVEASEVSSHDSGFEYWNGSDWVAVPKAGVSSAYYGNNARIELSLSDGNKYWRVQGGAV